MRSSRHRCRGDPVVLALERAGAMHDQVRVQRSKRGGKVAISGFGHFELRRRAARAVRNPRTGASLALKASIVPAFRAAKGLKEMVNRKR